MQNLGSLAQNMAKLWQLVRKRTSLLLLLYLNLMSSSDFTVQLILAELIWSNAKNLRNVSNSSDNGFPAVLLIMSLDNKCLASTNPHKGILWQVFYLMCSI